MSYLKNQMKSFRADMASSSTKLSSRRVMTSARSPIPSFVASSAATSVTSTPTNDGVKRKRPEPSNVVYSQPVDTGVGRELMSQVTYAIEYLKNKMTAFTFDEIIGYLSLQNIADDSKMRLRYILMNHVQVEYDNQGSDGKGTFMFRPLHNIRNGDQLLQFLQAQPTARGMKVAELRDGWPTAEEEITTLEARGNLLVTRHKKDNRPRMVWLDDPSLQQPIDDEFQVMWTKIKLPEAQNLAEELEKVNMVPTSKKKEVVQKTAIKKKERKKPRRTGKITNSHMAGVLKNYSK